MAGADRRPGARALTRAIRRARLDDVAEILAMVRELAAFEREPDAVSATEADLLRDGWGPEPRFEAIIAELDGRVAGFALWFHNYSTWEGRHGLYVEDLYVRESARGHGLGRLLMASLAAIAVARGCTRAELSVLDWNPARGFYEAIGLCHKTGWLGYRMTRAEIAALAREAPPLLG